MVGKTAPGGAEPSPGAAAQHLAMADTLLEQSRHHAAQLAEGVIRLAEVRSQIGRSLRLARESLGLSAVRVAGAARVDLSNLRSIEQGSKWSGPLVGRVLAVLRSAEEET